MTDPSPNTDSEAIDVAVDFKTEYLRLEDSITREREADVALGTLRTRLLQLIDGKIPFGDHSLYLLFTAIPNLATKILKNRYMDDELSLRANGVIKRVLDVILKNTQHGIYPLAETLALVFDNDCSLYFRRTLPTDSKLKLDEPYAQLPRGTTWSSEMLEDNINYFGSKGGFDALLALIGQGNEKNCPMNIVALYIQVFYHVTHPAYLVESRQKYYVQLLLDQVTHRLTHLTVDDLRQAKDEDFENVFKHFANVLKDVPEFKSFAHVLDQIKLQLFRQCLNSPLFDKRVYGIKVSRPITC
jgi:hypothetical protein